MKGGENMNKSKPLSETARRVKYADYPAMAHEEIDRIEFRENGRLVAIQDVQPGHSISDLARIILAAEFLGRDSRIITKEP